MIEWELCPSHTSIQIHADFFLQYIQFQRYCRADLRLANVISKWGLSCSDFDKEPMQWMEHLESMFSVNQLPGAKAMLLSGIPKWTGSHVHRDEREATQWALGWGVFICICRENINRTVESNLSLLQLTNAEQKVVFQQSEIKPSTKLPLQAIKPSTWNQEQADSRSVEPGY